MTDRQSYSGAPDPVMTLLVYVSPVCGFHLCGKSD